MRVLFLITDLGVGGAERQVVDLADRFARQGASVVIAYLTGDAKLIPTEPSVRTVGFGVSKSPIGLFRAYAALRRLIRSYRPEVVHSHMIHANLLARVARLTTNMPVLVCTAHSTNEGGKWRMLAYRLTDSLCDVFTNVGAEAVTAFEAKGAAPPGRMVSVANGIDIEKFHDNRGARATIRKSEGAHPTEKIILAVGRLTEAKDYPNLLRAFASIQVHDTTAKLWIAGGGELMADLIALAAELCISDRTTFLGVRSDVHLLFSAADVYVLSSAWEGLPLVVGESMASEKVVVATDCGGVREMLGDCGFLVPPGDPAALANGLRRALELTQADARLLGGRARERVLTSFSLQAVVRTWGEIYQAARGKKARDVCNFGL